MCSVLPEQSLIAYWMIQAFISCGLLHCTTVHTASWLRTAVHNCFCNASLEREHLAETGFVLLLGLNYSGIWLCWHLHFDIRISDEKVFDLCLSCIHVLMQSVLKGSVLEDWELMGNWDQQTHTCITRCVTSSRRLVTSLYNGRWWIRSQLLKQDQRNLFAILQK